MKKVLFTFSLVAATFFAMNQTFAQAALESGPKIEFENEVLDYGTIDQYSDGVREFVFKNTGNEPLVISKASGSCGCTVPTWPTKPIKPGEKSTIKVEYDTKRVGKFQKTVTLHSDATNAKTKVVRIKGEVIAKPEGGAPVNTTGAPVIAN